MATTAMAVTAILAAAVADVVMSNAAAVAAVMTLSFYHLISIRAAGPFGGPAARIEFKCFVSAPFRIQNLQTAENREDGSKFDDFWITSIASA